MTERKKKKSGLLEILLTKYRGTFATIFLLPISFWFELYLKTKKKISFWLQTAPKNHDKRVEKVRQQLLQWQKDGCPEKLTTGRSGWFAMSEVIPKYKLTNRKIYLDMMDILEINEEARTVRVEPEVNMGQITAALNPKGWTLAVLPELDALTVGGLVNGFGIETSSHKYGLFQYICESFEIITPDGELKICSKDENPELYSMIPWSYGTLGFLVAVTLKIVPAKKYVRLEYHPIKSQEELVKRFKEESEKENPHDFVEAIVNGKEEAVLLLGDQVDKKEDDGKKNRIGLWYKPWFYSHIQKMLKKDALSIEYIPLRHYYHRHTRPLFWMMHHVIPAGNHPLYRFFFGWAIPPQMSLMKYFETETTRQLREKNAVTQDMLVPMSSLKDSLNHFHENYNMYPLWLCPMAVYEQKNKLGILHPKTHEDGRKEEMFVDIGAYGIGNIPDFDGIEALKNTEQFVIQHEGYQAMYAKTMLSEEDFRKMFDHSFYDKLRDEIPLAKKAFPDFYHKLSKKARIAPAAYKKLK